MKIGLDMMGGDFAPAEAVKGAVAFLSENNNEIEIVMFGDKSCIDIELNKFNFFQNRCTIIHTSQVIEMQEHPTKALKEKQDSSIAVGFKMLATGEIDAFISAGIPAQ